MCCVRVLFVYTWRKSIIVSDSVTIGCDVQYCIIQMHKHKENMHISQFRGLIHILCHQHFTDMKQITYNSTMNVLLHELQILQSWFIFIK